MNISVTKNKVSINTDYILNDGEYNVNTCSFSFSDDYTNDLVKKAVFIQGSSKIEMSIINNQCEIPSEVLNNGTFELHVYAYEVDGDNLVIRYSPTYDTAYVRLGSYVENAEAPEVITPTQFEQYMQAMNDGLNEVANVDIDAEQTTTGGTVTITNREGQEKTVTITNGQNGADGRDGKDGVDGKDAKINNVNTLSLVAGSNITLDQEGSTLTISSTGGGGGTGNYNDLTNKPQINGNTLSGNKTSSQLGVQSTLVSGTNIKTINNTSILGSGNIEISGSNVSIDNDTITTNSDDEIQTVGIKDASNNTCKIWNGTLEQYNTIQNKDSNTFYNITDDYVNNGVPISGTTGQVLTKTSNTDYDTEWTSLHNFSHETWTFTLDDDSTVDKEVVLW